MAYTNNDETKTGAYFIESEQDLTSLDLIGQVYSAHIKPDNYNAEEIYNQGAIVNVSKEGEYYKLEVDVGFLPAEGHEIAWPLDGVDHVDTAGTTSSKPEVNSLWFINKSDIGDFDISPAACAEGINTIASGKGSHVEGSDSIATGTWSHAGGKGSLAEGYSSLAHGNFAKALGFGSIAIGDGVVASGMGSMARGRYNVIDTEKKFVDIVGYGQRDS
jgi:hypothetical protein